MKFNFFTKKTKQHSNKKGAEQIHMSLEEKKSMWMKKWDSDDYNPMWFLYEFPPSIRALIDNNVIPKGIKIVDIGCGSGNLSFMLYEEGYIVTAFDFAKPAIDKAKKKHTEIPGKLEFHVADATQKLPFQTLFRVGIDRGTFHTIPIENRPAYANNMASLIESEGVLIIIFAAHIAARLVESSKHDTAYILRNHIRKIFSSWFSIEDFRDIKIECHNQDDTPGFLIILKRNLS